MPVIAMAMLGAQAVSAQAVDSARVVPIQITGDPATRFSLVILGDGYTAAELPAFRAHVDKHLNILWSLEPFRSYRNYINVYAVEIVSGQSGITCDPAHREQRTTPLSMQFGGGCQNPNARGINVNQEAARRYARLATPDYDQILSIANTDTYGGIGGGTATTSGGNALGPYITPHELGHSLGRLQDEYTYSGRGVRGPAFTGEEPNSIHHTLLTEEQMRTQQLKWWRWLGEPGESGGVIGRYEGGQSRVSGIWRPSKHSMMISLGYYFDQVSRERMAQRISGQVDLIAASTPTDAPVSPTDVIWIETAHPNFHELTVSWQVDSQPINNPGNSRFLGLAALALFPGQHTVSVKVVDPTDFVRDPAIRDTSFTETRTWTVGPARATAATPVPARFTASTQTARAVSGSEVVYVETTHPSAGVPTVSWSLAAASSPNSARAIRARPWTVPPAECRFQECGDTRSLPLAVHNLSPGTYRLTATLSDPNNPNAAPQTVNWTVDNTKPTVSYTLSEPVATIARTDGFRHYFMRDQFTMKLEPSDDQPGYVVTEFRVNGDGWHHYYGWPDAAPGTPFLFTPRGTNIKELVYGSLSSEGLSPQPWEPREPGWGTHRIEYRARDAAGNIGDAKEFRVTIQPTPTCTTTITGQHAGNLNVANGVTCVNGARVSGSVTVAAGATLIATNATISGSLTSSGAAAVELIGSTVEGAARIDNTTGNLILFGNQFRNTLSCTGNTNRLDLGATNATRGAATGQCAAP